LSHAAEELTLTIHDLEQAHTSKKAWARLQAFALVHKAQWHDQAHVRRGSSSFRLYGAALQAP